MSDEVLRSLRAALESSPENVPLRRHLADVLLSLGRAGEAQTTLLDALRLSPNDSEVKLALTRAYRMQGKYSAAHVILEEMIRSDDMIARARLERARTLFAEGSVEECVREYRKAIDDDPEVADRELEQLLGVDSDPGAVPPDGPVDGKLRHASEGSGADLDLQPIQSDVDFSQVGGMAELKDDIRRKIIQPLQHPELYAAYGKKVGGGILLYGPPGCGKTHIARATAGEIQAKFLSIGIHDVLDMWVGKSERNLHAVFETARANAPCVLFFDEADALGASRGDLRHSAGKQTINQFLAELDGLQGKNDGVLVLAATNAPWQMDAAFRRPGRFDRVVFVAPPDAEARQEILRILLVGKPSAEIDYRALAKHTDHFSGADLAAVVDGAVEAKIDEAVRTGAPSPLKTKDLITAAKRRKPTTREWFRTVRNYVLYANEDGIYDELKPYLDL